MRKRARDGTCLRTLVRLALPLFKAAQDQCPRTGRGAKPGVPDWVMMGLIMIVLLRKQKTKSRQYRFLQQRRAEIAEWLGSDAFPSRATYFRRYRKAHRLYRVAIRLQGEQAIAEGIADPQHVA